MATIDDQLLLHERAGACGALLLRPGMVDGEPEPEIFAESVDRGQLMAYLAPALALAWPDHPSEPEEIRPFLEEALDRLQAKAQELGGAEDFVPAAHASAPARGLVFEHLQMELSDVRGGVETEELWTAFDALDATAPITHLARAGLRIKLRALGSFLIGQPSNPKFDDELVAADFFPAGTWEQQRDPALTGAIAKDRRLVNKQFAHLTLTRPLPEERDLHQPASYGLIAEPIIRLLDQFTNAADARLLPDWWQAWFETLRDEVLDWGPKQLR